MKVPRGPSRGVQLMSLRRTEGAYVASGQKFVEVDDWKQQGHTLAEAEWVGTTTFIEARQTGMPAMIGRARAPFV